MKTLVHREKKRVVFADVCLEVGKVKALLNVVEVGKKDNEQDQKVRLTSLRSFGRVIVAVEFWVMFGRFDGTI